MSSNLNERGVHSLKRSLTLWFGLGLLVIFVLMMVIGPEMPFIQTNFKQELVRFKGGDILTPPYGFSKQNWFGTDDYGRDLLSMVVVGSRSTFFVVIFATVIRYLLAIPLGLLSSKKKGFFYRVVSGYHQLMTALPTLFFAILFLSLPVLMVGSHRIIWVGVILGVLEVGRVAQIIQEHSYQISHQPYIEASRTIGVSPNRLYVSHYLPAILPEVIVNYFLDAARVMLLVGQLGIFNIFISQTFVQTSFGGGEFADTSYNWSTLLAQSRIHLWVHIWIFVFPAFFIILSIIMFQCLGEGLRRVLSK